MTNDDIDQKLALLPEGLAEENFRTWQLALETYQELCSMPVYSQVLTPVFEWAKVFSQSEQAKLFRTDIPGFYLTISTKDRRGLEHGDRFIVIDVDDEKPELLIVSYFVKRIKGSETIESFTCKNNEIMTALQPLLDRLWNDTRGKKNA